MCIRDRIYTSEEADAPQYMEHLGIETVLVDPKRTFMSISGGSTMIGFTIIWILLETTQGKTHPISPVTALWIIAIPLMDMVAIMYRRLRKGMSPFSPDRQHIHHLIMRAGFTSRQAFVLAYGLNLKEVFTGLLLGYGANIKMR